MSEVMTDIGKVIFDFDAEQIHVHLWLHPIREVHEEDSTEVKFHSFERNQGFFNILIDQLLTGKYRTW